jgi:O-antigen ligase
MIKNRTKVLKVLLLFFALFPIIPNNIKGLPVIVLLAGAILFYKKEKFNFKRLFINTSLFSIYIVSFFYSNDFNESIKKIETALSILIIPLTFFLLSEFKISKHLKIVFVKWFIMSTSVFSFISLLIISLDKSTNFVSLTDKSRVLITNMQVIGQHPIYASIFLSLALIFLLSFFSKIKSLKEKLFLLILNSVNLFLLILLSSKGVLLSFFAILLLYLINAKMVNLYKYLTICFLVFSLIALFKFSTRMQELIKIDTYSELNTNLSTSIRLGIYECSINIIKKNWLLGYGIGDAQRELNLCYANKNDILLMNRFNSHNQYLDVLIKTGLIGLFIFLVFLFCNLIDAIKKHNTVLVMALVFYLFVFLTENVLSRQSGVIFFFFLISFFNSSNYSTNAKNEYSKS